MEEEVNHNLHSFHKGKNQGPDGFGEELFQGFYGFLKDDLQKVVRESHHSGTILVSINSTFWI